MMELNFMRLIRIFGLDATQVNTLLLSVIALMLIAVLIKVFGLHKVIMFRNVEGGYISKKLKSVENTVNAIITTDVNGIVVQWNNTAATMFLFSEEEMLGRDLSCIMSERDFMMHSAGMAKYRKTGISTLENKTIELNALTKNKKQFPLSFLPLLLLQPLSLL